jgi:hypothetical protein
MFVLRLAHTWNLSSGQVYRNGAYVLYNYSAEVVNSSHMEDVALVSLISDVSMNAVCNIYS